jgi:hypothetical protein
VAVVRAGLIPSVQALQAVLAAAVSLAVVVGRLVPTALEQEPEAAVAAARLAAPERLVVVLTVDALEVDQRVASLPEMAPTTAARVALRRSEQPRTRLRRLAAQ